MPKSFKYGVSLIILVVISCATTKYQENIDDYQGNIQTLKTRLELNSESWEAMRDLGVIYFQTKHYSQARNFLKTAYKLNPDDPKTMFYYGLSLEFDVKSDSALSVYENYTTVSKFSPYRKLMSGRYKFLTRQALRQQMKTLVQQEKSGNVQKVSEQSVAVFPFIYRGKDMRYEPLGKGLSEMMLIDLGKLPQLKLLERVRTEALISELKMGQSPYVDPATAPRLGKMLGAGRIVGGVYNVFGNGDTQMDVSYWDVSRSPSPQTNSESDKVDNFFKIEKALVFQVIDQMGIELTPEERDKISFIPTKNLQAFLAYSMGLEKEDNGDFRAAGRYYDQAVKLDAGFSAAKDKMESVKEISAAAGSKEQFAAAAQKMDPVKPAGPQKTQTSLVTSRLQNLGNSVNSNFVPGEDSRESTEEAGNSGVEFGAPKDLPPPPPPPAR